MAFRDLSLELDECGGSFWNILLFPEIFQEKIYYFEVKSFAKNLIIRIYISKYYYNKIWSTQNQNEFFSSNLNEPELFLSKEVTISAFSKASGNDLISLDKSPTNGVSIWPMKKFS